MATGGADLMNAVVIGATGATGKCLVGSMLKAKVTKHMGMCKKHREKRYLFHFPFRIRLLR